MPEKESLLEKAIAIQNSERKPGGWSGDEELVLKLDLALAYHEGTIGSQAVAAVLKIQTKQVTSWFASTIMKGIRHGCIEVRPKGSVGLSGAGQ